jgi:parvulin-like peptidyl-prolyl isomerase
MKRLKYLLFIFIILLYFNCKDNANKTEENIKQHKTIINKLILKINNKKYFNRNLKNFINIYYSNLPNLEKNDKLNSRIFDSFVENKIILYKAEQEQLNITQKEIDDYLEKTNISKDSIIQNSIKDSIKIQKYLYLKIYKNLNVSNKEIQKYYNQHHNEFTKKDGVVLYQILVKNKEKAIKIRGELKNSPEKFNEIAKQESVSSEAKKNGLMGYFEKGNLPKDMENVVFSLKTNEISPVVESPYGYHIFKVVKKTKKRLIFFSSAKDNIKDKLVSEKFQIAYNEYLSDLKNELNILVFYKNLYFTYKNKKGEQSDEIKQNISFNLFPDYYFN